MRGRSRSNSGVTGANLAEPLIDDPPAAINPEDAGVLTLAAAPENQEALEIWDEKDGTHGGMTLALVLAKRDGVIFIPAVLASAAIAKAEFTNLQDAFNFELNKAGTNGAEFEGGWTPQKFAALAKWVDAHPDKLKMTRAEFGELLKEATAPQGGRRGQ